MMLRRSPRPLWAACAIATAGCAAADPAVELLGVAVLPADGFVDGPTSGQLIGPANGRTPPFERRQPVQGFSALLVGDDGAFLALVDNGFGTQENSPDFLLRVYEIRPDFVTRDGGSGAIVARSAFQLRDPDRQIPFPIVADRERYPGSGIPVDASIREGRLLTGADFDVESFRRVPDGTYWFGDEFGPFLLHADSTGRLLDPPIPLAGVRSPQHPDVGDGQQPTLPRSGGFEGMALSEDGGSLLPMLERPLVGDSGVLNVYRFDLAAVQYRDRGAAAYRYSLDPAGIAVAELVHWSGDEYLTIERDDGEGAAARFKQVFRVSLSDTGAAGLLRKTQMVDLLAIPDPHDLGGTGTGTFAFPFATIEAIAVVDDSTIVIVNDNNYPFSVGRHVDTGEPDDSEFILLRVRRSRVPG